MTHPRGPVVLSIPLDVQVASAPPPHVRTDVPGPRTRSPPTSTRPTPSSRRRSRPPSSRATGWPTWGRCRSSPPWPSGSGPPCSGSRWGRSRPSPPTTRCGAGRCRPSPPTSGPCWSPSTSWSPPAGRCSACSATVPGPRCPTAPRSSTWRSTRGRSARSTARRRRPRRRRRGARRSGQPPRRPHGGGAGPPCRGGGRGGATARATARAPVMERRPRLTASPRPCSRRRSRDVDRAGPTSSSTRPSPPGAVCGPSSVPERHGDLDGPPRQRPRMGSARPPWGRPSRTAARPVVALQGDGSLTLRRCTPSGRRRTRALPIALVVADNGGYEILRAGLEGHDRPARGRLAGPCVFDAPGLVWRRSAAGSARASRAPTTRQPWRGPSTTSATGRAPAPPSSSSASRGAHRRSGIP